MTSNGETPGGAWSIQSSRGIIRMLLALCCILGGCSTVRYGGAPEPAFDIDTDLKQLADQYGDAAQIKSFYKNPSKDARNEFITARLVQYNLRYIQFIRALGADKQQLDAASDLLILGINLAGTITGGEQAKTILAAVAAAVGGSKTIIDKDFFYEKTVPALVSAMNAQRKEVLVRLIAGTKATLDEYSLNDAISDLHDYYFAGTLQGAVIAIQVESGTKEKALDTEIRRLSRVGDVDVTNRARVRRTIVKLVTDGDETKITALLGALNLDTSGDLAAKSARLEAAHRAVTGPDQVNAIKAALAKAGITLLD